MTEVVVTDKRSVFFTIPGEPVGKARARTVRMKNGKTTSFTPEATVLYENLVKVEYQQQCSSFYFGEGQLRMEIKCYYGLAKSDSKKKRAAKLDGQIRPTKKPDIDNCIKAIADSLNGIAYKDDTQIVEVVAEKWYAEKPRVDVLITDAEAKYTQWETKGGRRS